MEDKKASRIVGKEKASKLVEGENVAAVQKLTSPNKREKRQARKLLEEADMLEQGKIVAQAEEDMLQPSMLSRKRKRSAESTIREAVRLKEILEQGKIVAQAALDLKEPGKLSRKQIRAAVEIVNQAAVERRLLRNKNRAEKEILEQGKIVAQATLDLKEPAKLSRKQQRAAEEMATQAAGKAGGKKLSAAATPPTPLRNQSIPTVEEEQDDLPPSKKKIKQARHKVELELEKIAMVNEMRWVKFKASRTAAEKNAALRLKILEDAISNHGRNKDERHLLRLKLWRKKTIATSKAMATQNKERAESFGKAGFTETSNSTTLAGLLEQQQKLIDYEHLRKSARQPKGALEDKEEEDPGCWKASQPSGRELAKKRSPKPPNPTTTRPVNTQATNKYVVEDVNINIAADLGAIKTLAQKFRSRNAWD